MKHMFGIVCPYFLTFFRQSKISEDSPPSHRTFSANILRKQSVQKLLQKL